MPTPLELKNAYDSHIKENNPHYVTSKQIWGIYNIDNTSDNDKPLSKAFSDALSKKMNVSDVYNSIESAASLDGKAWAAAQGYSMLNVIKVFESQDTNAIENRILWCEQNV